MKRARNLLHLRARLNVRGATGNHFQIVVRVNRRYPADFSVGVMYLLPGSIEWFHLRRYNGPHFHPNKIEKTSLNGYHIHTATERYQIRCLEAEGFAEQTDRYVSYGQAIECAIRDCQFFEPRVESQQGTLFDKIEGTR